MDSMRSLKGSLPSASAGRRQAEDATGNELFPTFQQAAMSLTTLFKKAQKIQEDQARAEDDGYHAAILDLLSFMDQKNLGLQDGEGWRIREWATAKAYPNRQGSSNPESDEEQDDEKRARSSSPVMEANAINTDPRPPAAPTATENQSARAESAPPIPSATSRTSTTTSHSGARRTGINVPSTDFTFHSAQQLPVLDMEVETTTPRHSPNPQSDLPTFQFNFGHARSSKGTPRHSRQTRQSNLPLGPGAGTKRTLPFSGYFDFGDFGAKDDMGGGGGGGKRSKPS
jgi:hypothetical protein